MPGFDRATFDREVASLREGCALIDRSAVALLSLTGKDRQRFLNGLVTCDVKALEPGRGSYGFFTSAQGKILADVVILALEDRLWLELPCGQGEEIAAHLGKFLVADRVEITPVRDRRLISLVGPRLNEALPELAELPAERFTHRPLAIAGLSVQAVRGPVCGLPGVTLWVEAASAEPLRRELATRPGVTAASDTTLEQVRVEAGIPLFGRDFGTDHFPQESGWEALAVSYTKGCYLGQEIVARLHYRGKPNHGLRRVLVAEGILPAPGSALLLEGQGVGRVGSAVRTADGGGVGIAMLHRKAYEPGQILDLEGGGQAEVALLPEIAPLDVPAPAG